VAPKQGKIVTLAPKDAAFYFFCPRNLAETFQKLSKNFQVHADSARTATTELIISVRISAKNHSAPWIEADQGAGLPFAPDCKAGGETMLTVTKPQENRIDITLSGKIDATSMRQGLDDLLSLSEGITNGVMMYRIPDFAMPSFAAIGVEMTRLPALFGLLTKFDRCAVLTDAAWLKSAAEMKGSLFGGIDIKAFDLDQNDEAEAWLKA
jgi:hypothetical protein